MRYLALPVRRQLSRLALDRKSTRLNSSHSQISYAVFCLKKKNISRIVTRICTVPVDSNRLKADLGYTANVAYRCRKTWSTDISYRMTHGNCCCRHRCVVL